MLTDLEDEQKLGGFMTKAFYTSNATLGAFRVSDTEMGARIRCEKSILRKYHRILVLYLESWQS